MRRFVFSLLLAGFGVVAGAALAQKAVTFQSSGTIITEVQISRTADGGFSINVVGENTPAGSDVTLGRSHACETSSLTAAQRTALQTIRTAALACWNSQEGL